MGQMFFPDEDVGAKKRWNIDKIPLWILIVLNILFILVNVLIWGSLLFDTF